MNVVERIFEHRIRQQIEVDDKQFGFIKGKVFYVGGKPIDFVSSFPHLRHVITDTLDDGPDITKRLGSFIGQVNDVLCFFGKVSSDVKVRLFRAYCTS